MNHIEKQSEFCRELMGRINADISEQKMEYGHLTMHSRIENDIVRLRRELNDLRKMLNRWEK